MMDISQLAAKDPVVRLAQRYRQIVDGHSETEKLKRIFLDQHPNKELPCAPGRDAAAVIDDAHEALDIEMNLTIEAVDTTRCETMLGAMIQVGRTIGLLADNVAHETNGDSRTERDIKNIVAMLYGVMLVLERETGLNVDPIFDGLFYNADRNTWTIADGVEAVLANARAVLKTLEEPAASVSEPSAVVPAKRRSRSRAGQPLQQAA